jgi:hypothetical protein
MDSNDTWLPSNWRPHQAARPDLGGEKPQPAPGQEQLVNERAQLLNKNELARSRVEAMINRLKSLENNA